MVQKNKTKSGQNPFPIFKPSQKKCDMTFPINLIELFEINLIGLFEINLIEIFLIN